MTRKKLAIGHLSYSAGILLVFHNLLLLRIEPSKISRAAENASCLFVYNIHLCVCSQLHLESMASKEDRMKERHSLHFIKCD